MQSGGMDGPADETPVGADVGQLVDVGPLVDDGEGEDLSVQASGVRRPVTGDDAVDAVLEELDAVTDEPLDRQIEVGERVHRVLQGRLTDLGQG